MTGDSTAGPRPPVAIGVDTGGTHTDLVLFDRDRLVTLKVPSTPDDLTRGIAAGIGEILGQTGVTADAVERFVYATTYVTNLIVEGQSSRIGLITTHGFRDVLEIGRASRKPHIYDIHWRPAPPLVPRKLRRTVRERIAPDGEVLEPPDEAETRAALAALAAEGCEAIAVTFLHAYANPAHERRVAELAQEVCPEVEVSISSDVVREFREFERTSTTVANAFIKRSLQSHLGTLRRELDRGGVSAPAYVMRGNGGVSTFASAAGVPVALAHSGPMGGIIGGTTLAKACGLSDIITLDMGGTSADISLVSGGTPVLTGKSHIGPYPLLIPMLDLVTIGAGGGSIAWLERGEKLRVGPRSAGSVPGPACYGQGGEAATVTDCNLIAGRLNPGYFLAGARRLDTGRARTVLWERIAEPLGLTLEAAALGVIAISEAQMADAMRLVSVDRGIDPRDFTLVAFGAAGPLHAIALAEALSMRRVLIPPAPGNLSATGLILADIRHDLVRTIVSDLAGAERDRLVSVLGELLHDAEAALAAERVAADRRVLLYSADLRYQGQNYELNLPITPDLLAEDRTATLAERFHEQHRIAYGYHLASRPIQIVNLRVTALGVMPPIVWPRQPPSGGAAAPSEHRHVLLPDGTAREVPIYRFVTMRSGQRLGGPALIEYPGSTLFVPPEWSVEFDDMLNARAERGTF